MGAETDLNARLERVVKMYSGNMLKLAYAYVRSIQDAEDIVQEVFLSIMKLAPAFSSAEHEKAYLLRATVNRAKNHLKSRWFKNRQPLSEDIPYVRAEDSPVLAHVLSLSEKYRLPLHLHYYEGYSIKEIAEILGERPATVGTHLARGREALRTQIGGMENV